MIKGWVPTTLHTQAIPPKSKLLWYKSGSVLGQGGFGITYLARDPNLDQNVAIKEYLPSAFASRDIEGQVKPLTPDHEGDYRWGLERFIDEGRTLRDSITLGSSGFSPSLKKTVPPTSSCVTKKASRCPQS